MLEPDLNFLLKNVKKELEENAMRDSHHTVPNNAN